MKFFVTYREENDLYSENVVYASDEKEARAWYELILKKPVVGIRESVTPYIKPGMPIVEVPINYDKIIESKV